MPHSVSTLTPLDPSPGYGPAVASGISSPDAVLVPLAVPDAAPEEDVPDEVVLVNLAVGVVVVRHVVVLRRSSSDLQAPP